MRTPLWILGITLVAGIIMYLISKYQSPSGPYDSLNLVNKDTSVINRMRVLAATNPTEIYYLDSAWLQPDSTPLRTVLEASRLNFMRKEYGSLALIITYNDSCFYDLEIDKPDSGLAYDITFDIQPGSDTIYITGAIDTKDEVIHFRGPMMRMYRQFILTYNNRMPPAPPDSMMDDSKALAEAPLPNKTITVIEN